MKKSFCSLWILLLTMFSVLPVAAQNNRQRTIIKDVSIIDVARGRVLSRMNVTIVGERISSIQKNSKITRSQNEFVIDGKGKFLIPGLWDMHVHVDDQGEWMFPLFLANGVLGVRDMGSSSQQVSLWREARNRNELMPQIVAGGLIVTGMVNDEDSRLARVSNRAEAEKAVENLADQNFDLIKVYDYLSRDAYIGITRRAAQLKIPVQGHLPFSIDAREAAEFGQKSIEHDGGALGGMMLDVSTREADLKKELREKLSSTPIDVPKTFVWATDPKRVKVLNETFSAVKARQLAQVFARHKTFICPTIISYSRPSMPIDERILSDSRLKYVPKEIRNYAPAILEDFKKQSAETTRVRAASFARHIELYSIFRQNKVQFLAGTDSHPSPVVFPGFSLHDELKELVDAGFSTLEALQTATLNPAIFLNKTNDFGTVATGTRAELILLDGNPLVDIDNTKRIHAVITQGRFLHRTELNRMLEEVEAFHEKNQTK